VNTIFKFSFLLTMLLIILVVPIVKAKNCEEFMGHKIVTEGTISCTRAKNIYKSFLHGHIPKGWTCGQSVGGCGNGTQSFIFR